MAPPVLFFLFLCGVAIVNSRAQSNYGSHGVNIEYLGGGDTNELPDVATLDGKVTELNTLSPVIKLNRTEAHLNCASGAMMVVAMFKEPFYGIIYANFDRNSPCFVSGHGELSYEIEMPLKGCGTLQGPQRVFTNNIIVRFHPGLEMEGDEVITIVCRYPPPIVAPPDPIPLPVIIPLEPVAALPHLQAYHILLIICAILFLGLLLLGLGCSYYCLKKRNIQVIKKIPPSSIASSEISPSHISMFEGLKIPRAHALSTSSSEAALVQEVATQSDTIPSDYPSESPSSLHSEVEDIDTMLPRPSSDSSVDRELYEFEHTTYVTEENTESIYSDRHMQIETAMVKPMRVKKAPTPPPLPMPIRTLEERLHTVLERQESITSNEVETTRAIYTHVPEKHPSPLYSQVQKKQDRRIRDDISLSVHSIPDNDDWSIAETLITQQVAERKPERTLMSWETDMHRTDINKDILERATREFVSIPPPPPPPPRALSVISSDYQSEGRAATDILEPDDQLMRRKQLTTEEIEDVYLRTITEKKSFEDTETHRREVTEFHMKPRPTPAKFNVAIRSYPDPEHTQPDSHPDWETFSETTTEAGSERLWSTVDTDEHRDHWDSFARVMNEVNLTEVDKRKWREIITTESTLRTLLIEAHVREDYERIVRSKEYGKLFEPRKWEIIMRILAPSEYEPQLRRYRKNVAPAPPGKKVMSPLYEYSDDDRRRRPSLTSLSMRSEADVRSMTEEMVNFSRADRDTDIESVSSGPSYRAVQYAPLSDDEDTRSPSRPSLARSESEFTEEWALRSIPDQESLSSYHDRYGSSTLAPSTLTSQHVYMSSQQRVDVASSAGDREEIRSMAETVFSANKYRK